MELLMAHDKRRKHQRFRYAFFVTIAPSNDQLINSNRLRELEIPQMASVQNMSGGGVKLVSNLCLLEGAAVDLRISLACRTVETVGKVLQRLPAQGGYGYRIAFNNLSAEQQDSLSDCIIQTIEGRN